jgi:ABC-type sugar transport system permease subunit
VGVGLRYQHLSLPGSTTGQYVNSSSTWAPGDDPRTAAVAGTDVVTSGTVTGKGFDEIGGYLLALLLATNTGERRFTCAVVFIPVVIGLGVSSLLWYWLFSPRFGLINAALQDLGIIDEPILWLGVNPNTSLWAIIVSITW